MKRLAALLTIAILGIGCSTTDIDITRERQLEREFDASVAIVPLDASSSTVGIVECIRDAIRGRFPNMRFVDNKKLQEAAGPEMSYLWTDHPEYDKRMASAGIRYVITVVEQTVQQVDEGTFGGVGGYGAAVTVLGVTWDRRSYARAEIFDVKQGRRSERIQKAASGRPWIACVGALIFCVPIGSPTFTESTVCNQLSEAVLGFLSKEADSDSPHDRESQHEISPRE